MAEQVTYGATWGGPNSWDVTVPSGSLIKVRQLQLEDIVELGLLDKVDSLGGIVQDEVVDPVRKPADRKKKQPTKAEQEKQDKAKNDKFTQEILRDKSKFKSMSGVIDKIVTAVVIQPSIESAYRETADGNYEQVPDKERKDGTIYSDSIGLDDKMYIFDQCFGGIARLEQFREESDQDVGDVASESGNEQESERVSADS